MPVFETNGKKYNVKDEHIDKFINQYPAATTIMERDGTKYRVKAVDYNKFMGSIATPQPTKVEQPAVEQPMAQVPEPMKSDTIQPVQPIQSPKAKLVDNPDDYYPTLEQNTRNDVAQMTEEVDEALNEAKGASARKYAEQTTEAAKGGFWKAMQNAMVNTAGAVSPTDMQVQTQQQVWRGGQDRELAKDIDNLEAAEHALENARRTINEADINAKNGTFVEKAKSTYVGGAARGFGQKLFDVRTWDMGVSDFKDQSAINDALDAAENGTLTESQEALLNAKAQEMAVQAYFGSYVGRGYKAGSVTAESLPFMLEMCINPASTLGKSASSRLARWALKKFGTKTAETVGRVAGRVLGDVAAASAMTATTGSIRTAADAMERMSGGVAFDTDEQGHAVFDGRYETPEDVGTAIRKAFAATTIENYSEMLGAYFAPMLGIFGKGTRNMLDKITAGRVGQFLDNVASNDFAKAISAFEKSAQWSGNLGEFAEELAGGTLNAIIVGDQTFDSNSETGVFNRDNLIDTFLGVALLGGSLSMLKTAGYGVEKYQQKRAVKRADVAAADAFGSVDEWDKIKTEVDAASNEELPVLLGNIISNPDVTDDQKTALMVYVGAKQREKGAVIGEQKRRENPNVPQEQVEVEQSFDNGAALETPQEKNDAQNMYEYQQQQMRQYFGLGEDGDVDAFLGDDPIAGLQRVSANDQEAGQVVLDYLNAKATVDGVFQRMSDDAEAKIAEADAIIASRTNRNNGLIQRVRLKNDKQAYVLSGDIVMTDDGDMVNVSKSSESLVVIDAITGKKEYTYPSNIAEVYQSVDAEAERQTLREQVIDEYSQKLADDMNGTLAFAPGDNYTLVDDQGAQHNVQIIADNGDGTVAVVEVMPDGVQQEAIMAKSTIQDMSDTHNQLRLGQYLQDKKAQEIALAEQEQQGEQSNVVAEQQPVSAMSRIPTNEAGEQLFEQAPVQDTWAALVELNEGDTAEAVDTAQQMYNNAKKELDKAQKQKPKVGTSVAEIQSNKAEYKARVSAAQAKADYWANIMALGEQSAQPNEQTEEVVAENVVAEEAAPVAEQTEVTPEVAPVAKEVEQPIIGNTDQLSSANGNIPEINLEERIDMQKRIVEWLSEDNLKQAEGKTREEILDMFGNEPMPIAYIPAKNLSYVSKDANDPRIYCGKGYFIDHALRNHANQGEQIPAEDVDVSKYLNIQSVLNDPDSVKETFVDGKRTVVFVKKIGRYFAELTQFEENGKIVLHKSLFSQKKEPYAKLKDIRQKETSSEGGVSSISRTEESSAPAISLESRGDVISESKDTTTEPITQEVEQENLQEEQNEQQVDVENIEQTDVVAEQTVEETPAEEKTPAPLQLAMSNEEFDSLLASDNREQIEAYLKELDQMLVIDENSPFVGEKALREEFKQVVEQYGGKDKVPAEVMDSFNARYQPYADLQRAIYDRKYALGEKLAQLNEQQTTNDKQKESEAKTAHKQTAFNGFLANKTDLAASTAEKALQKKYKFEDKNYTVAEYVEQAVASGNVELKTKEVPKYAGASRRAWNKMDAREQAADAERVKNSGTKTEYYVNGYDLGKTGYDYAQYLQAKAAEQTPETASESQTQSAVEPEWLQKVPTDGRNFMVYTKVAGENNYSATDLKTGQAVGLVYASLVKRDRLQSLVEELPKVLLEGAHFQIRDTKGKIYYSSEPIETTKGKKKATTKMTTLKTVSGAEVKVPINLYKYVSTDKTRAYTGVYFDPEGFVVATNGSNMIAIKHDVAEADAEKFISKAGDVASSIFNWRVATLKPNTEKLITLDFSEIENQIGGKSGDKFVLLEIDGKEIDFGPKAIHALADFQRAFGGKVFIGDMTAGKAIEIRSGDNYAIALQASHYASTTWSVRVSVNTEQTTEQVEQPAAVSEQTQQPTEPTKQEPKPKRTADRKIEDYGEKIAGARKDILRNMSKNFDNATIESLIALPFAKAFVKPDLKKLVEAGVLRPDDAKYAEAIMWVYINKNKPKARKTDVWAAKRGRETRITAWAKKTFDGITRLRDFIEADEATRDELIAQYGQLGEQIKAEENAYRNSKVGQFNAAANGYGDLYSPNPIEVIVAALDKLNYQAGDKITFDAPIVKAEYLGRFYNFENQDGEKVYAFNRADSIEEAIDTLVLQAKIRRGDTDIQYPTDMFSITREDPIREPSGIFTVYHINKRGSLIPETVEGREAAEKKVADYQSQGLSADLREEKKIVGYATHRIRFKNRLTDVETIFDEKFGSEGEARQALEERYDEFNDLANDYVASLSKQKREQPVPFEVTTSWNSETKVVKYVVKNTETGDVMSPQLDTRKEAEEYYKNHIEEWKAKWQEMKDARKKFVFFDDNVKPREGKDYRNGRDVTAEDLATTFGFRGIQFGNWTNDADRQAALNQAYDAFMDLADILGVSPKALSLAGELGIAFGARGGGSALAHYEPDEIVINLTKTKGAGSLAHEWWHALDNYFSRQGNIPMGFVTSNPAEAKMRVEMRVAWQGVVKAVKGTEYAKRSMAQGDYWGRMLEMTARLFGEWTVYELAKTGRTNHFLSRGITPGRFDRWRRMNYAAYKWSLPEDQTPMPFEEFALLPRSLKGMPFPTKEETEQMGEAVRNLFDVVQEKVDDQGNVVLFQRGDFPEMPNTEANRRAYNLVREKLQNAGIKVHEVPEEMVDGAVPLQTPDGTIYGWAVGGEIYLTPQGLNANTAIHEYSHLWVEALRQKNPRKWSEIKEQLKATPFWNEVLTDPNYENIRENEDAVASEVLARLSGNKGAERLANEAQRIIDAGNGNLIARVESSALVQHVKRLLRDFYAWVSRNIFGVTNEATISQFSDMVVDDLLDEVVLDEEAIKDGDVQFNIEGNATLGERSDADSSNSSSEGLPLRSSERLRNGAYGNVIDGAKIKEIEDSTKRLTQKINKFLNGEWNLNEVETENDAVRELGNNLGMRKSRSSNSYYGDFYEGNYLVDGNILHLRISTHPASAERMGNADADHKVSIVIRKNGEHYSRGVHNGYEEIIYEPSKISPQEAANAVVNGVKSLIENGEYVDITGKADKIVYSPVSFRITPAMDKAYMDAVERGDMETAQRMVDEAAKKAGYNEKVYHGTQFFGFTKFGSQRPSGAIFTSDKRNVAANYGGGNRYASVRRINQGYKGGRTSEEVISDARSVFDQEWRMVNDKERSVVIDKIEADAKRVMQKMNSLQIDVPTEIQENVAWVENIIYSAADGRENGNEGDEMQRMLLDDYEQFVENRSALREWLGDHRSELTMQQQQYLDYLIGYEVFDVAVDAGHSFANAFSSDEMATVDGLHFVPIRKLWEETRKAANVGSYELYGNLGDRPLIINGEGKAWYGLDFNGMRSTDDIVEWAKQEGYTSVVFNNISDNGDPSDVKVFFNPEQVKSADPVTYDDNGNVIPLSQRFNNRESDIRYRSDVDEVFDADFAELESEYQQIDKNDEQAMAEWRAEKKRVVENYLNYMTDDLALPASVFVYDHNDKGSLDEAVRLIAEVVADKLGENVEELYLPDHKKDLDEFTDAIAALTEVGRIINGRGMYNVGRAVDNNKPLSWFGAVVHENAHHLLKGKHTEQEFVDIWNEAVENEAPIVSKIQEYYAAETNATKGEEVVTFAVGGYAGSKHTHIFASYIKGDGEVSLDDIVKKLNKSLPLRNELVIEVLNDLRNEYQRRETEVNTDRGDQEANREREAARQGQESGERSPRRDSQATGQPRRDLNAIATTAEELAEQLHTPIRIVRDVAEITDDNRTTQIRKRAAKGWYDVSTGEVVVVAPNATSVADVQRTVIHEVVAHNGLRELFGADFDTFLDNVYRNVDEPIRRAIANLAARKGWDFRVATEEYLASLAETTKFEEIEKQGWWQKIKDYFMDLLRKVGIKLAKPLTNDELRYILWRSYQMQKSKGAMAVAEDVDMQRKLSVGNFRTRQGSANVNTAEEQQIIAEAQRNGTYLKAPNGKPTNLTPKQWVQVRTKAFKRWFGDWILPTMETPIHKSKGTFANLGEAEQWAKKNLQGQERENKYTGEKISIGRKSVSEMLNEKALKQSHSINAHLAALRSVLDFIETGIPAEVHPDTHGRDFDVMRLYNAIDIDNKVYRVKSTVRKVKQGDKYYTYEIQEMELIEERGANPNREGETPHNGNTSNNSITAAKLLKGVKKTNNDEDILSHSQILDANGEPLVVEHSTWNEDFYTFNIERLGESSGDEGLYGAGFYFGNVGHTQLYGDRAIRVYLDAKNPLVLPEDNIMKSFDYLVENFDKEGLRDIVVKNGKKSATLGKIIDVIKEVQAANANGEYDELIEQMKQYWSGAEDRVIEQTIFRKVGFAFYRALTPFIDENIGRREFSKSLQAAGYDGVIFDNREYVVYSPTQIKSAEINSGEFDPTDPDIRFRSSFDKPAAGIARDIYNEKVRTPKTDTKRWDKEYWSVNTAHRLHEAYVDSMAGLKTLQEAILKETGNEIHSYEDAYKAENRMSSENKAQAEIYMRDFFQPLMDEVGKLSAKGATLDDIKMYLIAKHGLERNVIFSQRAAAERGEEWDGTVEDYSGLTDLTGEDKEFQAAAQHLVQDFEAGYDTKPLWDKINAATKESLRINYESGLMSKETYDKVRTMFTYYVPLRGWDRNVATDEYEYLTSNRPMLSPTLKTAKGRKSLADDPIATIGYMAESAIIQGNRNLMKQKFLNFVLNNPTSLATVSEQWYVRSGDEWVPSTPDIPADATADEVDAIVKAHEQKMEALGDDATKKRDGLKIGLHTTAREGQEHVIRVKRAGKEYCIYINGNPIAAQAINGLTNPNTDQNAFEEVAQWVKNLMARAFTSRNPAFIVTNLSLDVIWAGTAVAVKEDKAYAAQYTKNVTKILATFKLPVLLRKFQNGTLDMNNDIERYFAEFIRNGGETGFTQINTVEDYKRDIQRMVKDAKGETSKLKKAWQATWGGIEFLNRSAEDITRFSVYMTSRQMGRDTARSVWDAKEITVNFNKKGRGTFGASMMNFAYIFFNASIQSLANFGRLMYHHPKKMTLALSTFASAGMIAPMFSILLSALLGDDDDNYWDLPEWVRRNNIVLFNPFSERGFFTIPLPHELRPFYGMGELFISVIMGKESVEGALGKAARGFADLLPIDVTGNGGNMAINLSPTVAQPVAQLIANTDYFGVPIYRRNDYNELDPDWTKAYKGTNPFLVESAKWLNEVTGGDNVVKGKADINPAIVEHLFESYLGGMGKTFNKTVTTFSMLFNKDAREWRNVPVLSSFYQVPNDRTSGSQINREYFEARDEADKIAHQFSGYKKQLRMGAMEYAEKLDELMKSPIFARYQLVNGYNKMITNLNTALKQISDPADREQIETTIMELKAEMLAELEKLDAQTNEDASK